MKFPLSSRTKINKHKTIEPTLVVDTAAYAANDVVGGLLDLSELVGFAGGDGVGGGTIRQALITDDDAQNAALDLYLYDGQPTTIADQAAFAPTNADNKKLVGVISFATYSTVNSNGYSLKTGQDIEHGTGQLWGYLVTATGSTPTYSGTGVLGLKITGWID